MNRDLFRKCRLGNGGPRIFERNLEVVRGRIAVDPNIDYVTRNRLLQIIDNGEWSRVSIRIIARQSLVAPSTVSHIAAETGLTTRVGF